MEVDGPSFAHHLLGLLIHISEADFVSFDLELSGIPSRLPNKKPRADRLTLEDRYAETKQGADRYQILQVGLTCARFDYITNEYILRPYNINLSPLLDERLDFEREISFQSGACTFLLGCGFDLGAPFASGVQYLSREEAERAKRLAYDRIDKVNPISDLQLRATDTESLDFVRRCREAITAWQKSTSTSLEITSSTGLPGVAATYTISRFEKRLVHQLVRAEFPGAVAIGRNDCIRILDFDPVREADNTRRIKHRVKEQIARQTGFRWVFEALAGGDIHSDLLYILRSSAGNDGRDRFDRALARLKTKQPVLVGHNMFTDIVYLYRTFVGPLPDTLDAFSNKLHALFPRIVDTKYLATHAEGDLNASPSLEEIAKGLQNQPLPRIVTHEDHNKYNGVEAFHEAGYDSLLTATIMLRLAAKLGAEHSEQSAMKEKIQPSKQSNPTVATDTTKPLLQRSSSSGGIRLAAPETETDALPFSGREQLTHPPPSTSSSTVFTTSSGKKKRNKSKAAKKTTAPQKFETKNIFDTLTALSLSEEEAQPPNQPPVDEVETERNIEGGDVEKPGHWADEVYVQDQTGWVCIPPVTRGRMEVIPSFEQKLEMKVRTEGGEGEKGAFWDAFGNRLRVFGTEERECRIGKWPLGEGK